MSKLSDYLRLMRISLLPTAWSNVLMGYALSSSLTQSFSWVNLVLAMLCSSCLYCAGMVLNDVFDIELDRIERPERVLPSGKIWPGHALIFGLSLITMGIGFSVAAATFTVGPGGIKFSYATLATAVGLTGLIFLYNKSAKHTIFGPLVMGMCRGLNVLLGCTAGCFNYGTRSVDMPIWFFAIAITIYVAGITFFAKEENQTSSRRYLVIGSALMGAAAITWLVIPFTEKFALYRAAQTGQMLTSSKSDVLYLGLMAMMLFPVARKAIVALATRHPSDVKRTVVTSLLTIIMIDASICYLVSPAAPAYALGVACLIIPAYLMTRRIMAT